jgi:hypothetical protein
MFIETYLLDEWKGRIKGLYMVVLARLEYCALFLLRLERKVVFTNLIKPACLPAGPLSDFPPGTELTVTGWGALGHGNIILHSRVIYY